MKPLSYSITNWTHDILILVGGLNNLEKYSSMGRMTTHILWKIKKVPNHQPILICFNPLELGIPHFQTPKKNL